MSESGARSNRTVRDVERICGELQMEVQVRGAMDDPLGGLLASARAALLRQHRALQRLAETCAGSAAPLPPDFFGLTGLSERDFVVASPDHGSAPVDGKIGAPDADRCPASGEGGGCVTDGDVLLASIAEAVGAESIEMRKAQALLAEARDALTRLRRDCAEAYQVVGCMAGDTFAFDDPNVERALDNLHAAADGAPRPHDDLTPWPKPAADSVEAGSGSKAWRPTRDVTTLRRLGKLGEEIGECGAVAVCYLVGLSKGDDLSYALQPRLAEEIADVHAQIDETCARLNIRLEAHIQPGIDLALPPMSTSGPAIELGHLVQWLHVAGGIGSRCIIQGLDGVDPASGTANRVRLGAALRLLRECLIRSTQSLALNAEAIEARRAGKRAYMQMLEASL